MYPQVIDYLRPRLDPDHIKVRGQRVRADAVALLEQGLIWTADWDDGKVLGAVRLSRLLTSGHHAVAASALASRLKKHSLLHQHLTQGPIPLKRRAQAPFDKRVDLLMADIGTDRPFPMAELEALAELATTRDQQRDVRLLRQRLARVPAPTLPPRDLGSIRGRVDIHDFIRTGDLEGCQLQLEVDLHDAEEGWVSTGDWVELACMCRFFLSDDARAEAILERLGFDEVGDAWVEVFGERGRARVQQEKQEVLDAIEAAFDGIPFPGPEYRSLYQAEAADNYAGCDQSRDHKGRWQDLPREQILACQWALPHIPAASLPYYLPALMSFCVREHDQDPGDHDSGWVFESVRFHCDFNTSGDLRDYMRERHAGFTRAQFGAIARFARYYGNDEVEVERWQQLADGGDWPV